jgi:hydroxypyruvate reductase
MSQRPEIAVIADLPGDVRQALGGHVTLADHPLEGQNALQTDSLGRDHRVIATRAVLGVPPGLLDHLPQLELVLSLGAGLDHIDVAALSERGIRLVHTPDQFTEDVADYAMGLIFAAQRRIVEADRFTRSGRWLQARFPNSRRVTARKVGIAGLGRIGRRLAEKCAALGMAVSYTGSVRQDDCDYPYIDDIADLAAQSDILVLTGAVTERTRRSVNSAVLSALGSDGILINVARGALIDEGALISALENGTIAGAALDVFDKEPGVDSRLLKLENVILSPHAASFTLESRQAVIDHLVGAALDYFSDSAREGSQTHGS